MDYIVVYSSPIKPLAIWVNNLLKLCGMTGGLYTDFNQYDCKIKFFLSLDYENDLDETYKKMRTEAVNNNEVIVSIWLLSTYKEDRPFMPVLGLDPFRRDSFRRGIELLKKTYCTEVDLTI